MNYIPQINGREQVEKTFYTIELFNIVLALSLAQWCIYNYDIQKKIIKLHSGESLSLLKPWDF